MLVSTCSASWLLILNWLLPPVAALLSATALLVGARARSTSEAALSISLGRRASDEPLPRLHAPSE